MEYKPVGSFLGHFLLTHLLLDKLKSSPTGGRIINVTASAYKLGELAEHLDDLQFERREYKNGDAYVQSKLAVMLFTRKLAKYLEGMKHFYFPSVYKRFNIHSTDTHCCLEIASLRNSCLNFQH